VTVRVLDPPTFVKLALVGESVDVHAGGAPAWVNVWPATVSVSDRGDVDVFASTE